MTAASSGLRDRKKAGVRASLAESALRLFAARGFDGVTVDEITSAADVSRRTFFRYFATKEAVVLSRREDQLAQFRALLTEAREEAPFVSIRRALIALADEHVADRARVLAVQSLVRKNPSLVARDLEVDRSFEGVMVECLMARSRRTVADRRRARILAAAIMGAVRVTLEEWAERDGELDLRKLGEASLDLLEPLAPRPREAS